MESLWHVYIPLAQWILEQKRARSHRVYVFGINGTVGRGKTTLAEALHLILQEVLPAFSGQPLVLSLDDYYLPKKSREQPAFRARGYDPEGISNRGPAGTHDIGRLRHDLKSMEVSTSRSRFDLPVFDKQADDRLARPRQVQGKVGVVLLEGWLVGCRTDVPLYRMSSELRRSVAQALHDYRPVFDRLDALWAFRPPSIAQTIHQRWRQQQNLDRLSGREGMGLDQVRRFVNYFYRDAWEPGLSSPVPSESRVSFWASMNSDYRFTDIRPGGRRPSAGG
jgi:D-glycerate 3-kinase